MNDILFYVIRINSVKEFYLC